MIYVITERDDRSHVKIGYTASPDNGVDIRCVRERLSGLQVSTWRPLVCIAAIPGTMQDEQAKHIEFKAHHVRGEWFTFVGPVVSWVEANKLTVPIEIAQPTEPKPRWSRLEPAPCVAKRPSRAVRELEELAALGRRLRMRNW